MSNKLTAKVLQTVAEVEEHRHLWSLWPGHRDSDIDFYLAIVRSRPEVVRPHIVVLYRDGHPFAMLIGRVEQRRLDFRVGYLSVCKPKARVLGFVMGALRGDSSEETCGVLVGEIMRALRRGESDVAALSAVDVTSPLHRLARKLPGALNRDYFPSIHVHWRMTLPQTVDELYSGLSKDHRSQVRRKAKKLLSDFGDEVKVLCLRYPADVGRMMQDVEEVAKKTYQRGLGVGFMMSEETRDRLSLQADKGWLRAYLLYVRDQPCAFWVGSVYTGIFFSDYLGHDPDYSKHSVGTFLTVKTMEALCEEGAKGIDFGPGDSRYKQQFSDCRSEEAALWIFARNFNGYRLNALHSSLAFTDLLARGFLNKTKLLPRLKKFWRERANSDRQTE